MTLRFSKSTDPVDAHFNENDPRVVVKMDEVPVPLYPEDKGFWNQFSMTLDAVCLSKDGSRMRAGVSPGLEAIVRNGKQAAALVFDDWPTDVLRASTKTLRPVNPDTLFSWSSGPRQMFTDGLVMLDHLLGWSAHMVSPNSFAIKDHFKVPRPEEVAAAIARNEIDAPDDIVVRLFDIVPRATLDADPHKFTAYSVGCPPHGSYNAMHAAAAGATNMVVKVLIDMTPEERATTDLSARNMAHWRSVAGVHYPMDNACGLWLGEEVMRRLLPAKLAEFGFDADEVLDRVNEVSTDWIGYGWNG